MNLHELVRDPLYQLNLLLWMLTPSENDSYAGIEPVLSRAGYTIHSIEGDVRLPLRMVGALKKAKIEANDAACPDLLVSGRKKAYLIIECKATLFGHGNDSAQRQARTLMLQTPSVLTESLTMQPGGVASSHLLYLTAYDANHDQLGSLKAIHEDLTDGGFSTAPFGLLALRVEGTSVVIDAANLPGDLATATENGTLAVQKLQSTDDDPRPLYRIAWMPGSEKKQDAYNEEHFAKRVLVSAAAQIARAKLYKSNVVRISVEQVLDEATSGFYKKWKKRSETKLVRDRAVEILRTQIGKVRQASLNAKGEVEVYVPDRSDQDAIVEKLRDWSVSDYPTQVQGRLFEGKAAPSTSEQGTDTGSE